MQLSNYLKVPISYFFEDFPEYLINAEKIKEGHLSVNYNFLIKLYSELTNALKDNFIMTRKVSVAILGSTGFVGLELVKIL